jgi:small neutral amino acid transporter SnatA (MarC family)
VALRAVGAFLGIIAIAASIYLAYRYAENLARLLGATGLEVLVRLSACLCVRTLEPARRTWRRA